MPKIYFQNKNFGAIVTLVLVFGAIFLLLLSGLLGFILLQLRQSSQRAAWAEALNIAEAGVDYYRWCLNNNIPNCSLEKDYSDASGNLLGHFSLQVSSQSSCGQTISTSVTSTGWTNQFPNTKRKIKALYAKESVAKYAYVLNSNVWVGKDHEIKGPYHSNGGIRFDGSNQSIVTSAQENWICTTSFGCGPLGLPGKGLGLGICPTDQCQLINQQCICPGVFSNTDNSKPDLFSFPVPLFDFDRITADLAQMKSSAQSSGIYLPPSKDIDSAGKGWHLILKPDGTFEAKIITGLASTYAYSLEEGWHYDYFTITGEYLYNTYTFNPGCQAVFVEDNLWVEGIAKGKITIASANLINPNFNTNVVLPGNLLYTTLDGSDGLSLIAQGNVLIGPQSPNVMKLSGIFIAQKGRFSRNHYPGNTKDSLEIFGSIVSNGRVGTQWVSGSQIVSGYRKRDSYFDQNLVYSPPAFVPAIGSDIEIVNWEEVE